jgi:hypothetical protein
MTVEEIGQRLLTQDNQITSDPIFLVQQVHRQGGMDTRHCEKTLWYNSDNQEEADPEKQRAIEAAMASTELSWGEKEAVAEGYTEIGYVDTWEYVTACFTEAAAKEYIEANAHNLNSPRVYVASGYRNHEWNAVRKHLMMLSARDAEIRSKTLMEMLQFLETHTPTESPSTAAVRMCFKVLRTELLKLMACKDMDEYLSKE